VVQAAQLLEEAAADLPISNLLEPSPVFRLIKTMVHEHLEPKGPSTTRVQTTVVLQATERLASLYWSNPRS
jgi:hypothetical protein